MATQAPQASRRAAPLAAKAAAIVTWAYAACFGLPAIPVAVYLLQTGRLPRLFDAFPVYGGPWYDSGQPERFAAQLGAFLVMMLVVSWGGWLLWRGSRAGVVVAVATIPVEALFWYGFALPIPPLLTLVRVVVVDRRVDAPKSHVPSRPQALDRTLQWKESLMIMSPEQAHETATATDVAALTSVE